MQRSIVASIATSLVKWTYVFYKWTRDCKLVDSKLSESILNLDSTQIDK